MGKIIVGNMIKVAFVCVHNSCRSQMAEGFAKVYGVDLFTSYSAGTEKYHEVKLKAVQVMNEIGIDISNHYPKLLNEIPPELDILITMGCGVSCPYVKCKHREDWVLEDPSGGSLDDFRKTRNLIDIKVKELVLSIKENNIL